MYLKDMERIVTDREAAHLTAYSRSILGTVWFTLFLYAFKSFQYIDLYVFEKKTRDGGESHQRALAHWRLLSHDMMLFLECPIEVNIFILSYYFQIGYFIFWSYYFARSKKQLTPATLTYSILFGDCPKYFLDEMTVIGRIKKYTKLYQIPCRYCILLFGKSLLLYVCLPTLTICFPYL